MEEQTDINTLKQAAEQGDMQAQFDLAHCYEHGRRGAPKDPQAAAMWGAKAIEQLTKAAEQGNCGDQSLLATLYLHGRYVSKNKQEAIKWYAKAAAQGDSYSRQCLEELTSPVKAFFKRLFRRY